MDSVSKTLSAISKKRKPGRPKKILPGKPGATETIVSRKPKSVTVMPPQSVKEPEIAAQVTPKKAKIKTESIPEIKVSSRDKSQ